MVRRHLLRLSLLASGAFFGCSRSDDPSAPNDTAAPHSFTESEAAVLQTMWPLPSLPASPTNAYADDPWAIQLGQYLFFDTGLSASGDIACSSCHDPRSGWSDGLKLGEGTATGDRHTMSLFNVGYNRWSYWDGRCDTLWCQAISPIEDEREMGNNRVRLAHQLTHDPLLNQAYRETFGPLPDVSSWPANARPMPNEEDHEDHQAWLSLTPDEQDAANRVLANIGKSLAAYERTIISRDSPFDQFAEAMLVDGDPNNDVLSNSARRGLSLFIGKAQCHFCHAGAAFTNQEFANIGLADRPWLLPADRGRIDGIFDLRDNPFRGDGRYSDDPITGAIKIANLTTTGEQEGQFKVPSLRSIALSPPYMHGGHFDTLDEAVRHYGDVVETPALGHREDMLQTLELSDSEIADIVAFLESLTGAELPDSITTQPESAIYTPR